MNVTYQQINEALAKGIATSKDIKKADTFLKCKKGEKPDWLDDFLRVNKEKMIETICRTTRTQEMASTAGYNEGYFNEIIQNANDLQCGSKIEICGSKENDLYTLTCSYNDDGFSISNIYGFLNREMSDKNADNGHSGKFGIGIKSLFSFAHQLTVTSNVLFDFFIRKDEHGEPEVIGKTERNLSWDGKTTVLTFTYNKTTATEFNIQKLTNLIDFLNDGDDFCAEDFFWSHDIETTIFDTRSLLFMNVSNKKSSKNVISEILFSGESESIALRFLPKQIEHISNKDLVAKATLEIDSNGDSFEETFLIFATSNVTIAYPMDEDETMDSPNRHYATYFIKEDSRENILPTSALIHSSKYVNMHRTDLGNSEVEIGKNYNNLAQDIRGVFEFICSKECGTNPLATDISDVFHKLLCRYMNEDAERYCENPFSLNSLTTEFLPKNRTGECKKFVLNKEKKPGYSKVSASDSTDIATTLESLYKEYFVKEEVFDFGKLSASSKSLDGVKLVYDELARIPQGEKCLALWRLLGYFPSTAHLICYRITGVFYLLSKATDNQIDEWLTSCKKKDIKPLLKLFGRSGINDAIDFDGGIISKNLSFHGYLFNNRLPDGKGIFAIEQNKTYDEKYKNLKTQLLKRRLLDSGNTPNYMVRCLKSWHGNWDGYFDYYSIDYSSMRNEKVDNPLLLLEQISNASRLISEIKSAFSQILLFEEEARRFYSRNQVGSSFYSRNQQIISIDFINHITLNSLNDYFKGVDCIEKIYKSNNSDLKNIKVSCLLKNITTQEIIGSFISALFSRFGSQRSAFTRSSISISRISENNQNECKPQMQEFLLKKCGKSFHVYSFDSGHKSKKSVCYFMSGVAMFKASASDTFSEVCSISDIGKDVYIFCDNFGEDIKNAITIVLRDMRIDENTVELFEGYIQNRTSTKTLDYSAYSSLVLQNRRQNTFYDKKKLVLDWASVKGTKLINKYNNEFLLRLLTARGSYDVYCPLCADIPIDAFFKENKKNPARSLVVLENASPETNDEFPYILTLVCGRCKQKLLATLHSGHFDGKKVNLEFSIAHGQHEKITYKQSIELSPINIVIMREIVK